MSHSVILTASKQTYWVSPMNNEKRFSSTMLAVSAVLVVERRVMLEFLHAGQSQFDRKRFV